MIFVISISKLTKTARSDEEVREAYSDSLLVSSKDEDQTMWQRLRAHKIEPAYSVRERRRLRKYIDNDQHLLDLVTEFDKLNSIKRSINRLIKRPIKCK